jgi:hypothetical protein
MKFDINKLAGGAVAVKIDKEYTRVINNIYDPNTSPKFKRKMIIEVSFNPTEDRGLAEISVQTSSKLAPITSVKSRVMIEKDFNTGEVLSAEIKSQIAGQVEMNIPEEVPKGENVIDLKAQKTADNKK